MNYTLVNLTSPQSIGDNSTTPISWHQAINDSMGGWNIGAPTRITIPAGVSKVRFSGGTRWASNGTGIRQAYVAKNGGTGFDGEPANCLLPPPSNPLWQTLNGAIVDVTPGDYFEFFVIQKSGANLDFREGNSTWFQCEVIA